mgnify:FL=1
MKGYIYKVWTKSNPFYIYYGSTTEKSKRKYAHLNSKRVESCSARIFTNEYNDCEFTIMEELEVDNKRELELRERYYIKNYPCINLKCPRPIDLVQYKKDKDLRHYYKTKEYIECECGTMVMKRLLKRHKTSKKHKLLL